MSAQEMEVFFKLLVGSGVLCITSGILLINFANELYLRIPLKSNNIHSVDKTILAHNDPADWRWRSFLRRFSNFLMVGYGLLLVLFVYRIIFASSNTWTVQKLLSLPDAGEIANFTGLVFFPAVVFVVVLFLRHYIFMKAHVAFKDSIR